MKHRSSAATPALTTPTCTRSSALTTPNSVTLLANWIPFEEPNGGPNFYPFATETRYNINIDNDGDAIADLVYTWEFTDHIRDDSGQFLYNTGPVKSVKDETLNFFQTYNLTVVPKGGEAKVLVKDAVAAPSNTGKASMPDYGALRDEAVKNVDGGGKTFAGQADDPFFLDLRVFDLLYGTDLSEAGEDSLSGYNVNTIGLQLPKDALAAKGDATGNPVIGVWSTTLRKGADVFSAADGAATSDGYVQVSRLGNPLVNEVVVPLKFKDAFNGLTPDKDATVQPVVDKVLDPILPALIEKIYKIPAPAAPRNDLFEIFLTGICKACAGPDGNVALPIDLNSQQLNKDKAAKFQPSEMLRLNTSIAPASNPNRLGVLAMDTQGFPNGRRLTDDVVDIALQAVEGAAQTGKLVEALAAGDGVNAERREVRDQLPLRRSAPQRWRQHGRRRLVRRSSRRRAPPLRRAGSLPVVAGPLGPTPPWCRSAWPSAASCSPVPLPSRSARPSWPPTSPGDLRPRLRCSSCDDDSAPSIYPAPRERSRVPADRTAPSGPLATRSALRRRRAAGPTSPSVRRTRARRLGRTCGPGSGPTAVSSVGSEPVSPCSRSSTSPPCRERARREAAASRTRSRSGPSLSSDPPRPPPSAPRRPPWHHSHSRPRSRSPPSMSAADSSTCT